MAPPATARREEVLSEKGPEALDGRFFVGSNGDNLDRTYVYRIVRRYLKLAGIKKGKRGPHILRHTFCTRLHQKGVGPFTIKDLAGHKNLNTTMRYVSRSRTRNRLKPLIGWSLVSFRGESWQG